MKVLGVTVNCVQVVAKQSRDIVWFIAKRSRCAEITFFVRSDLCNRRNSLFHYLLGALWLTWFAHNRECISEIEQVSLSFETTKQQKLILSELNRAKTETICYLLIGDLKDTPFKFFEFSGVQLRTAIGILTQIQELNGVPSLLLNAREHVNEPISNTAGCCARSCFV